MTSIIGRAAPVHARPPDPGDPAQLVRGQQGRRARRAPEGARQHRAAASATRSRRRRTCGSRSCSPGSSRSRGSFFPVGFALRPDAAPRVVVGLHRRPAPTLVPAVPVALPRRVRRLGDRHAQHDHLRARVRLRALPRGARRAAEARAQVRVPERDAAADHRARALARRGDRRQRSSPRSSSPIRVSATRSTGRSRTRTTS